MEEAGAVDEVGGDDAEPDEEPGEGLAAGGGDEGDGGVEGDGGDVDVGEPGVEAGGEGTDDEADDQE